MSNAEYDFPELRDKILVGNLGKMLRGIDPHTEGPLMGLVGSYLALFSAAIGTGPYVRVSNKRKESGRHRLLVNALLVGPTGVGKGTATDEIVDLFAEADGEWTNRHVKSGMPNSGAGLVSRLHSDAQIAWSTAAKEKQEAGESFEIPEDRKNYPAIPDMVQCRIVTEWSKVLGACARDNDLSDAIRLLFEGKTLENDTKTKGLVRVQTPHVPVIGHISPEEYMITLTPGELRGGTPNRFLTLYVDSDKELPFGGDPPDDVWEFAVKTTRKAIAYGRKQAEIGWTEEARKAWSPKAGEGAHARIMAARKGRSAKAAFLGRARPYVRRIAALYAIIDCRKLVGARDILAAEALMWAMIHSVETILGERALAAAVEDPNDVKIEGRPERATRKLIQQVTTALKAAGPAGMTQSALNTKFAPRNELGDKDANLIIDALTAINVRSNEENGSDSVMGRKSSESGRGRHATRFIWIEPAADDDDDMPEAGSPKKAATSTRRPSRNGASPSAEVSEWAVNGSEKPVKPPASRAPARVPKKAPKSVAAITSPDDDDDLFAIDL
ncbi:hypothetical protein [Actinomadura rubrisoli]|uniref:DUF3987 domain-containing protein n=1 Tax=Actinomadura rubrisoli TaxID=2530368 RepID=A0A4R5CIK3_9ACTN|nr:hypothetical protein [Actinomadura rubrisoli]TDD97192.1 hypothetical protein E1298_01785 [Actinomadura rubrisoli]